MFARAYNRVLFPDGTAQKLVVVCFDDSGRFISHHPLTAEEPFVEWVGGSLDLGKHQYLNQKW